MSRVRIGTFINLTFHNPVVLARELGTIDVLSNGRLNLGFSGGWSPDEFEAIGVPMGDRGRRAEEALRVIEAIWRNNPVEFEGRYFRVPESFFDLKPVQKRERKRNSLILALKLPRSIVLSSTRRIEALRAACTACCRHLHRRC